MVESNPREKLQWGPHPHARHLIKVDGKWRSNGIKIYPINRTEKVDDNANLKGAKVVNKNKALTLEKKKLPSK